MIGTIKISQLPSAVALGGTESVIVNQVGNTRLTTVNAIVDLVTYVSSAGIATVAEGLTGIPNLNIGIVTATSYYGNGINLSGVVTSLVGYATESYVNNLVGLSTVGLASTISSLPTGGTPGQVLFKTSGTDYDADWQTLNLDPGGTDGQVQFNSSGSFAGIPNSSVDGDTGALTLARLIAAVNGAESAPPVSLTGTWFTGGTATTTKPQVLIEPAGTTSTNWDTDGTGLGVNASSEFSGNLLDLQVNGSRKAYVTTDAELAVFGATGKIGHNIASSGGAAIVNGGISIGNAARLWFSPSAPAAGDVAIVRSSVNCIKVTNGSTGTGYVRQVPVLVSQLPAAATVGAGTRGFVSDATSTTFAAAPVGGGANTVPVYSDGTNWLIG